jgi:hypothetical protein
MKAKRVEEFLEGNRFFFGTLVVVDYAEDMKNDTSPESRNAGGLFDCYIKKVEKFVQERYGEHKVLVLKPKYVCALGSDTSVVENIDKDGTIQRTYRLIS